MTHKITKISGYIPDIKDKRDNVFGSGETPAPIILPSGNWNDLFVEEELQNKGFDSFGCVTFSLLNAQEKLAKLLFGEQWNKSERYTYIASDTTPGVGNSPRAVADSIRHRGVIDEQELPYDNTIDTIEKFNSPKPLTQELLDKAKVFLRDYEFRYDFLPTTKGEVTREMLRAALYRAPICIAVYAWAEKNGKYYRLGNDGHLTLLTNVKENGELEVFDSYSPSHKTLSADFPIYTAIRVFLRKKNEEEKAAEAKKTNLLIAIYQGLIKLLRDFVAFRQEEAENARNLSPKPEVAILSLSTPENAPQPVVARETLKETAIRICKEEKLTDIMTERLMATVNCESFWVANAVHKNKDGTKDCGISQLNEKWYLKPNKMTCQDAIDNPEKCLRIMARAFKAGRARDWICYQKLFTKK